MSDVSPTPSIDALLALFDSELGDVSFPGASLADLTTQRASLEEARAQVETLRRDLDEALAGYQRTRGVLQATAERGHAYASVYAKDHPELLEKLAEIRFGEDSPKRRKQRDKSAKAKVPAGTRGVKRAESKRDDSEMAPLPFVEASAPLSAAS